MPGGPTGNSQLSAACAHLRRQNSERNLEEFRRGSRSLTSLPRFVMLELTQGCNLQCSMCRSRKISYREREMDRDIFARVGEILFPTAEMVDIRGWGESLIAPDVLDLIAQIDSYGARCRVVTNLSFHRPKVLDTLIEIGAMIDVSLDAATQEMLDVCREGASLKRITANLGRLARGLRERDAIDDLRIIATLQRPNLPELADLVRLLSALGVRNVILNEATLYPGDPNSVTGEEIAVDEAVRSAIQAGERCGVRVFAGTTLGSCAGVKADTVCVHPWAYATVGYDGAVGYCDHLIGPMMTVAHMGDITVDAFEQIWNGARWQELRGWHASRRRDDGRYPTCAKCYKHRNVDFEDLFEPRFRRHELTSEPS